jgi:hypothetical protein
VLLGFFHHLRDLGVAESGTGRDLDGLLAAGGLVVGGDVQPGRYPAAGPSRLFRGTLRDGRLTLAQPNPVNTATLAGLARVLPELDDENVYDILYRNAETLLGNADEIGSPTRSDDSDDG